MKNVFHRQHIEYEEPIVETETTPDGTTTRTVGYRLMRCEVALSLNFDAAARKMGRKACRNSTGTSRDGLLSAHRIGEPIQLRVTSKKV